MAHSTLAHILSGRALDLLNWKGGYHIIMEEKNRFKWTAVRHNIPKENWQMYLLKID